MPTPKAARTLGHSHRRLDRRRPPVTIPWRNCISTAAQLIAIVGQRTVMPPLTAKPVCWFRPVVATRVTFHSGVPFRST